MRRKCEHFARCGATGHYVDKNGEWTRCPCLVLERWQGALGAFFCVDPELNTKLIAEIDKNLILEGTRADVTRHVAGALIHLDRLRREWAEIHSQRLAEIWLGKDDELATTASLERADLVFLWLGWGELPNKRLPECILELIDRRWRVRKPLWVYMNFDVDDLPQQYKNQTLARKIEEFESIELD